MLIRQQVLDDIVAHARESAPIECCGLLVGRAGTIDESIRTHNLRNSPTAFQIDPADHFSVLRRLRTAGGELLGAYHSHPRSAPVPSERDIREACDTSLLHVIVSLVDAESPAIEAYRIGDGHVTPVRLERLP